MRLQLTVVEGETPTSPKEMKVLVDEELDRFDQWWAAQQGHQDPMHSLERMLVATYLVQKLQGRIP
jgi:hypothetical protein